MCRFLCSRLTPAGETYIVGLVNQVKDHPVLRTICRITAAEVMTATLTGPVRPGTVQTAGMPRRPEALVPGMTRHYAATAPTPVGRTAASARFSTMLAVLAAVVMLFSRPRRAR